VEGVAALDGAAGGHRSGRACRAHGANPFGEAVEGPRDVPDRIVQVARAVEAHDEVVDVLGDLLRVPGQKQAGAQERDADSRLPQESAEGEEVGVHERLAPAQDDPLDPELPPLLPPARDLAGTDLQGPAFLPDVAHETAAVAAVVREEDEDGEVREWVRQRKRAAVRVPSGERPRGEARHGPSLVR
jgi:hypothetical protein